MSQTSNNSLGSKPSDIYLVEDPALTEQPKQASTLTTLPAEVRLEIYSYILCPIKHTLRRQEDCNLRTGTKLLDTSLLAVSKQINTETIPFLYANHTFHFGVIRLLAITSHNFEWLKHASIELTTQGGQSVGTLLAIPIQELDKCCPALRTLTLHMTEVEFDDSCLAVVRQLSPNSLMAKALRALHRRLDRLSIVTYGVWTSLVAFRQSVTTDGNPWVEETLDTWPLISLDCTRSVFPRAPPPGGVIIWMSPHIPSRHDIHAFHLFGQKIAQKLQAGEIEKRGWFFAN